MISDREVFKQQVLEKLRNFNDNFKQRYVTNNATFKAAVVYEMLQKLALNIENMPT